MTDKMHEAQRLYFTQSLTQREIAARIGVSKRTIYNWIRNHAWDRLREASLRAPAMIAENISSQIVELQNSIAAREPGKRYPTMEEAEITRKLVACLDKVKKQPSLSQSQQTLRQFNHWLRSRCKDDKFCWHVREWAGGFIQAEAKLGYAPYQVEYGAESVSPVCLLFNNDDNDASAGGTPEELPPSVPHAPAGSSPADIPGLSANKNDLSTTGKNSPQEIYVDKSTETLASAASQPLPVPHSPSEETGNDTVQEETLASLINAFFEEQSITQGDQRALKHLLTTALMPAAGKNLPERKTAATPRKNSHSTALQPFPAGSGKPETIGKSELEIPGLSPQNQAYWEHLVAETKSMFSRQERSM